MQHCGKPNRVQAGAVVELVFEKRLQAQNTVLVELKRRVIDLSCHESLHPTLQSGTIFSQPSWMTLG